MTRFLAAALASLFPVMTLHALEIVGHRGASHDAPENTLPSFRLGYAQKADGDELDIHLTQDGQVIVSHDANTKRTAGLDKPILEQTAAELQALDAGLWKGEEFRGTKLPLLSEVLALIPEGRKLFIEIKVGPEIVPELTRVIKASGKKAEQMVIIGFPYDSVVAAKKALPELQTYFLAAARQPKAKKGAEPAEAKPPTPIEELIAKAKAGGLDGLDLQDTFPIDREYVAKVHAAGLKLYTWTTDDPALAKRLQEAGVDGITTNRPGWLREQLMP